VTPRRFPPPLTIEVEVVHRDSLFAHHLWHRTSLESVKRMQGSGDHRRPSTMFKLPAYDPVGIAMMGFGVLLVVALALVF
jgi:hypothetical protein